MSSYVCDGDFICDCDQDIVLVKCSVNLLLAMRGVAELRGQFQKGSDNESARDKRARSEEAAPDGQGAKRKNNRSSPLKDWPSKKPEAAIVKIDRPNNDDDIRKLLSDINLVLEFKPVISVKGTIIAVQCYSIKEADAVKEILQNREEGFHTFTARSRRDLRMVAKGLPSFLPDTDWIKELEEKGLMAKVIKRFTLRDGRVSDAVLLGFPAGTAVQKLQEVKSLCGVAVKWERPWKRDRVIVCHKCFQVGHIKVNCFRNPKCGKCGLEHGTEDCTSDTMYCVTCKQNGHKSGDSGCPTIKRIRAARRSSVSYAKAAGGADHQEPSQDDVPTTSVQERHQYGRARTFSIRSNTSGRSTRKMGPNKPTDNRQQGSREGPGPRDRQPPPKGGSQKPSSERSPKLPPVDLVPVEVTPSREISPEQIQDFTWSVVSKVKLCPDLIAVSSLAFVEAVHSLLYLVKTTADNSHKYLTLICSEFMEYIYFGRDWVRMKTLNQENVRELSKQLHKK